MGARTKRKESFVREIQSSAAFHIQPKNSTQEYLLNCIEQNVMTVCIGPAGTGKTYCSGMKIAQLFLKGGYDKVVLTRPNIATGKSLGHFPGTVEEKMTPWLKPILEVLSEGFGKGKYEYMIQKGNIEIQPLETVRGRSFENSLIVVDESQNLDMAELKALTTRIGENTKLVMLGDPAQSDLRKENDLLKFVDMCHQHSIDAPIVTFGINDIVRSDITAQLVKMFVKENI